MLVVPPRQDRYLDDLALLVLPTVEQVLHPPVIISFEAVESGPRRIHPRVFYVWHSVTGTARSAHGHA